MTTSSRHDTLAVQLVVAVSGLMIAFQVAGRATRDALFLSHFAVTSLPRMMAAAAVISFVAALVMARVLARFGPSRLVPTLLIWSAVLQVGEWGLFALAPRPAAVLVFIQFNAFGALLVSAFWSLVNERFDPRTGKRVFGLVGAAGTVGGIAGGLLAERAGALLSVSAMLPVLAVIHAVSAVLVLRVRTPPAPSHHPAHATAAAAGRGPLRILATSPYLRLLAAAVLLGTVSEGLLDYVFKAAAKQAYGHGNDLLRFFALFYTGINLIGGTAGAALGRFSLERLGLARTVGMLPWSVAAGGVGAIAFPGLAGTVGARAAEASVRMSFYRAGWELLFTPNRRSISSGVGFNPCAVASTPSSQIKRPSTSGFRLRQSTLNVVTGARSPSRR
ncbi:MAG: MFS transporter [Gemmatimonadota bacterium]